MLNSLTVLFKWFLLWKEALSSKCDILCIQETHVPASKAPKCQNPKFPHSFFISANAKRKDVMIAIRDSVAFQLNSQEANPSVCFLILVGTYYTCKHLCPSSHQKSFFLNSYEESTTL